MWDIYFITIMDKLHTMITFITTFGIIIGGITLLFIPMILDMNAESIVQIKKIWKTIGIILIVGTPLTIVLPSEADMYKIVGIGTTIEYIQSNDQAKQLPDKAVQALDMWMDELTKEKESKK